jgi:hypothetical protein
MLLPLVVAVHEYPYMSDYDGTGIRLLIDDPLESPSSGTLM